MNLAAVFLTLGVDESRWIPRSSKSVAGRYAGRGGFDTHPFPPFIGAPQERMDGLPKF